MFWAFCFILITSNGLFSPGHALPGTSLAQDVLIIQFSFSVYEYLWHDTSLTISMFQSVQSGLCGTLLNPCAHPLHVVLALITSFVIQIVVYVA